jgi:hypothetical protein
MHDGYMVGPRDEIFKTLEEFANGVEQETGCQFVPKKCKLFSPDEMAWDDVKRRNLIPESLRHMQGGIFVKIDGDRLRGVMVFNVHVREAEYIATILRKKAEQVATITRGYVKDLADEHPQQLWTTLRYSLQHRVTYWLITCTPHETKEMASLEDAYILKAVEAATRIDTEEEDVAEEGLRLPTIMKGGGVKKADKPTENNIFGSVARHPASMHRHRGITW